MRTLCSRPPPPRARFACPPVAPRARAEGSGKRRSSVLFPPPPPLPLVRSPMRTRARRAWRAAPAPSALASPRMWRRGQSTQQPPAPAHRPPRDTSSRVAPGQHGLTGWATGREADSPPPPLSLPFHARTRPSARARATGRRDSFSPPPRVCAPPCGMATSSCTTHGCQRAPLCAVQCTRRAPWSREMHCRFGCSRRTSRAPRPPCGVLVFFCLQVPGRHREVLQHEGRRHQQHIAAVRPVRARPSLRGARS